MTADSAEQKVTQQEDKRSIIFPIMSFSHMYLSATRQRFEQSISISRIGADIALLVQQLTATIVCIIPNRNAVPLGLLPAHQIPLGNQVLRVELAAKPSLCAAGW